MAPHRGAVAQAVGPAPVPDLGEAPVPEKVSVAQRNYPAFSPTGMRLGSFNFSPSIQLLTYFDDNIYGSNNDTSTDFVAQLKPQFRLASDWDQNSLAFYGAGTITQYKAHSDENIGDAVLDAQGRLDIARDQYLTLDGGYQLEHQPRYFRNGLQATDPNAGDFAKYPIEYALEIGRFGYVYRPGRLGWSLGGDITDYQYSNDPLLRGGGLEINSYRNETAYDLTPKVSYDVVPGYQAFLQASFNAQEYQHERDSTPLHLARSSTGFSLAAGTEINLGDILNGSIAAGYAKQDYQDVRLSPTIGPYFAASLLWNVSGDTSLRLNASRTIEQSIIGLAVGVWDTRVTGTVEHEVLRNVIATASVDEENLDYLRLNLTDNIVTGHTDLTWHLNWNLSVGAGLEWRHRFSSLADSEFDEQVVSLNIRLAE